MMRTCFRLQSRHVIGRQLLHRSGIGLHQRYLRVMRWSGMFIGMAWFTGLVAQSSVPELGRASDQGQKSYERSIGGRGVDPQRIYRSSEVDVPPVYPGGSDPLLQALSLSCDTAMGATAEECDSSFTFRVRFIVDVDGRATHPEVVGADHCPVIVASTRCAVQRLQRFAPARSNGSPVRTRMEVPMRYDRH